MKTMTAPQTQPAHPLGEAAGSGKLTHRRERDDNRRYHQRRGRAATLGFGLPYGGVAHTTTAGCATATTEPH